MDIFATTFVNWLYRIILRNNNVFGSINSGLVSAIQTLFDNNTIARNLSVFKNRYFPLVNDLLSDDGTHTFPTYSNQWGGANYDAETKSYKVTNTGGYLNVDLTDLHDTQNMIQGFTTEFWFRQISQNGSNTRFLNIGYWNGSSVDYVYLETTVNGVNLIMNDGIPVSITSPNLKMFDWLYVAVWRQNLKWYF